MRKKKKYQFEDPIQMYNTFFEHIYFSSGFAISAKMTEDRKSYNPPSRHGCLDSGYWCSKQLKEERLQGFIKYLIVKLNIYRVRRFLTNFYQPVYE